MTRQQTGLAQRIAMAQGAQPADMVVVNARVCNVLSGTIMDAVDVLIGDGVFLGFAPAGTGQAKQRVDAHGAYMLPGLIDAHVHIESSLLCPEQFAALVLPHGTTTIVADPHEIANVQGLAGIRFMLENAARMPLDVRMMLPSCVPATPLEHAGAVLEADDLAQLMADPRILGLGEMMNFPGVVQADPAVLAKLALAAAAGKVIDGHAPSLGGRALDAYCTAGMSTDHECATVQEMQARLERGMYVLLREGSAAKNLAALLQGVTPENAHRCCFCTDDASPDDIAAHGHMERHLRMAVAAGIKPMQAVRMASLNTAQCYGLRGKGAIAPRYVADFVLVQDLQHFEVLATCCRGTIVAEKGVLTHPHPQSAASFVPAPLAVAPLSLDTFVLPVPSGKARVIVVQPHSLLTAMQVRDVVLTDGCVLPQQNAGLVKIAVIERHKALSCCGVGLLQGYTAQGKRMHGAIATTIAHDSHNIVVAGDNDADMLCAVQALIALGGGICLVRDGKVLESLALPLAGLMSFEAAAAVAKAKQALRQRALHDFAIAEGVEPVMTLSFMSLVVIPAARMTDQGLFDAVTGAFVSVDAKV